MALASYTDKFWYPDGTLAVNIPVRVFPLMSNVLAPLFSDQAGTVPIANPVLTGPTGQIVFWAEEGEYWLRTNEDGLSDSFRVSVGSPNIDVFEVAASSTATGIVSGGLMSVSATPRAVDIGAMVAHFVDYATDPVRPTVTRVSFPDQTVLLDAAALARTITWWLIDVNGVVSQQEARPSATQRRTHNVLGVSPYIAAIDTVISTRSVQTILSQPSNQLADLMDMLGPFNVSGNEITPNGVNLMLNQAAGHLFERSFMHDIAPNDPHSGLTAAQSPASFRYATQNTVSFGLPIQDVDPANYDLGGVLTPLGGGNFSIQRVWGFQAPNPADQLVIQYGQAEYGSMGLALAAVGIEDFIPNPDLVENGAILAHLVVYQPTVNLSDPTECRILVAPKFARS